jgi:hypothetical protein
MQTFHRIVKQAVFIKDEETGRTFELTVGEKVLTSRYDDVKGTVTVFKSCWVPVPLEYFEPGAEEFTKDGTAGFLTALAAK